MWSLIGVQVNSLRFAMHSPGRFENPLDHFFYTLHDSFRRREASAIGLRSIRGGIDLNPVGPFATSGVADDDSHRVVAGHQRLSLTGG